MIKIGEAVPSIGFEVFQNNETKKTSLLDFKGKWLVMIFYPADFTFVCPTELEEAAEFYEKFKSEGAEILSVSTDTVFAHKAWHDNSPAIKKVQFPMAADPTGKLCREFGTYIDGEGLSLRATFIVDPDGVMRAMEMNDTSVGRSTKEIFRKLQALKFVAQNKGNVCPVSWEPGKKTLKPGMDLVGKI